MIEVNQTQESGLTVYTFEANNTHYEVMTSDGELYQVWSHRNGLSRLNRTPPKVYTLQEMAKRSKALANLAALIAA